MLTTRLNIRRTARLLNRGGFTLVELLVVIGIIAILAGVALGPITNGIKKAKQSSGVTSAHSIGLAMYSYANDNSQLYPDKSGGTADDVAAALLAGNYVTDPSIFALSADKNGTALSTSNNTSANIAGSGVTTWDFLGGGGSGASSTTYTWLPLLWNSITTAGTYPVLTTTSAAITAVPGQTAAFGTDGLAIFYVNNSAAFVTSKLAGTTPTVTMVTAAANQSTTAPTGYTTLKGK